MKRCGVNVVLAVVTVFGFYAPSAPGYLNNGFETDNLYAIQTAWRTQNSGAGDIVMFNENTGALVGTLVNFEPAPGATQDWGWATLAFAYDTGGNARLYAARRMDIDPAYAANQERYRDIEIAEFDSNGNEVRKVEFADTFLGTSHLGGKVKVGAVRFSQYSGHNDSIFVTALTQANNHQACKIYEVDLGLTTLKNTYSGPDCSDSPPRIDFDPETGRMYVVAQFLNEPTKPLGRADLVSFAYAPAGTNPTSYTTLIDGDVFARRDDSDTLTDPYPDPGRQEVSIWHKPVSLVYRGTDHEDGAKTLVVSCNWYVNATKMPQNEFYLDRTDSDGNLVRRSTFYTNYAVYNGQLDCVTGKIWLARLYGFSTNLGFICYDTDDFVSDTGIGPNKGYSDVCSPGQATMGQGTIVNNGSHVVNGVASLKVSQMPGSSDHTSCIGFENYANIHVNDYHVDVTKTFSTHLDVVLTRGQLHNKPVIISDDNSSAGNLARVKLAIERTLEESGANGLPGEHYEHYAGPDMHDDLGNLGAFIDGYDVLPQSSKDYLDWVATKVGTPTGPSTLTPGGKLTVNGTEFQWNGADVKLVGYSWTGAMVTKMCDIDGFLDALADKGVNLTRPWCIEQWAGTGMGAAGFEQVAWMPYEGIKGTWDLYEHNEQYFARVAEFIRKCAARGIVVQLTLFDRFTAQCTGTHGMYTDSPYYNPNNLVSINFLDCSSGFLPLIDLDPAPIWGINEAFINRMIAETGGFGNVIYEIMNEPHNQWNQQLIVDWHIAVADVIRDAYLNLSGTNYSIDLGSPDVADGLTHIQFSDGDTVPTDIGGRNCRINVDPNTDHYFYFGIDQLLNGAMPEAYITIEYYDTGSGSLVLQYDSTDTAPFPDDIYKNGGSFALTGSDTWMEHTFHVTDAYFGDRQNEGADFRIAQTASGAMYLDVVRVSSELPPVITQQPASLKLHGNNAAQFTVTATGEGTIQYQWQKGGIDLSDGGELSGTNSDTLQIAKVRFEDEGSYRCVVSNTGGDTISDSASLTLTVLGDFDIDDDVDQEDFGHFQICLSGPTVPQGYPECQDALLNNDDYVDLTDFLIFQDCMSGAGNPADPSCMD